MLSNPPRGRGSPQRVAPMSERRLADLLGVTPQQVNKYINGADIPSADKWEKILRSLGVDGPELGAWTTARERAVEYKKRCKRHPRAFEQPETTTPVEPVGPVVDVGAEPPSAVRPQRVRLVTVIVVVALVLVPVGVLAGDALRGRSAETTTADPLDTQCLGVGVLAAFQNHHSGRYLSLGDARRDALLVEHPDGASPPLVAAGAGTASSDGHCATSFSAPAAPRCLTADPDESGVVGVATCTGAADQLWVVENHWHHDNVWWKRIRPARNLGSCLQEHPQGDGTEAGALRPCSQDWKQQWMVDPVKAR